MITKLSIANFKSIRQLDLDCRKINLFIGEPNTGKSNILEALALLSWSARLTQSALRDYVRFELTQDLFYDRLLVNEAIRISVSFSSGQPAAELFIEFRNDRFELRHQPTTSTKAFATLDHQGKANGEGLGRTGDVKFFRFRSLDQYAGKEPGSLRPPDGVNLFSVVAASEALQETMAEFFQKYGLVLAMEPHERVFKLQKQKPGKARIIVSYPYALQSDTLRRIIFYTVAIASNKNSVLVFEEPESNAFPYYTKYLGERIALDETNQFFIATHNPYLLSAIVEKGRREDVQVFITYFQDYQTKAKPLTADEVSELMEADPFFNLDRFIEDGQ